jgi:2-polyprenyl-3-methyl-5-hydroxy-6-metoxy-1,4-benzoquinol methylase
MVGGGLAEAERLAVPPAIAAASGAENLACNLCGSGDYSVVFEAGVAQISRVVKCAGCGLLYANPRARGADVDDIRDYDAEWVYENRETTNKWRTEKESLQVRDYGSTRKFLADKFPNRGTLVEIGCGLGYLLNFFKQDGWNAIGIEPNAGLCMCARRDLGLTAMLATGSVTVATMMHVIEHVPDPMSTLREVHRILKPGGCFVMETPRYDTLMFKLLGRRERSVSCDGHIYFFTSDTLARIAAKAGFNLIKTEYVGRSMTVERLLYNVGVMSKSTGVQRMLGRISNAMRLNRMAITLNARDMQRMYLQKPA